jgi:sulfite reductase (ferredoxin)
VVKFIAAIERLYASMDASLRFKPTGQELKGSDETPQLPPPTATREADFRGVICPLNYVKTKLLLGQMRRGEILSVLLDEPGTRNVPDSVRQDGHEVLSVGPAAEHWKIVIRKA